MGTTSVRLNEEERRLLERVKTLGDFSTSYAIKKGLQTLERELLERAERSKPEPSAWEVYEEIMAEAEPGPVGERALPASEARGAVRRLVQEKYARDRARNDP